MKIKRIISLLAAAAVITTAFAGCSNNQTSSDSSAADSSAAQSSTSENENSTGTESSASASVLTADIAADTVIASPANGASGMDILFDSFIKEYRYFLSGTGLSDDTNEIYAENLRERREYIVNYLINEQIINAKFDEYGLVLSDEDMEKIKADAEENTQKVISQISDTIASSTTEELTEDELKKRAEAEHRSMLEASGLTDEDIVKWQITTEKQNRLAEIINKDVTVEYSEAEEKIATVQENAQKQFEESPETFNTTAYGSIWLPEGTRSIKQILIMFDEDTLNEVSNLRVSGDDASADALRAERAAALDAELAEVQAKIDAGEDFEALMNEYSDDGDTTISYTVAPKSGMYVPGFAECVLAIEEVGGVSVCLTDYGYHIIKYMGDAVVTDEAIKQSTDELYEYLKEAYLTTNFNKKITEWMNEYNYTINRELLLLGEDTED
ncbi:MAG: peptidylprolyl isomerase [Oscillospiraceae bacterium]